MKSQFCRNAISAESRGEQGQKSHEYTRQKIFESVSRLLLHIEHRSPNILWQNATPAIFGWFAGRTWQNNSNCYT